MCLITKEQPYKLNYIYFYEDNRVDVKILLLTAFQENLFFTHLLLVLSV